MWSGPAAVRAAWCGPDILPRPVDCLAARVASMSCWAVSVNRLRWLVLVVILAIVVLAILGSARGGGPDGSSPPAPAVATSTADGLGTAVPPPPATVPAEPTSSIAPGTTLPLASLLDLLPVAAEDRTGYKRSLFVLWIDADGDGCDTRREVLIQEAVAAPTIGAGCHLSGGRWRSPYDGLETTNANTFDIDHVVPLAEAWDSGASTWTADRRTRFANDLDVPWSLLAVSATSNRSKSDGDPADWLPPVTSFRCQYAAAWLAIKVRWDLAIDPREIATLEPLAHDCSETMPVVPAP